MKIAARLLVEQEGQSVFEYVIIASMISIVAIVLVKFVGTSVANLYNQVNGKL